MCFCCQDNKFGISGGSGLLISVPQQAAKKKFSLFTAVSGTLQEDAKRDPYIDGCRDTILLLSIHPQVMGALLTSTIFTSHQI